MTMHIQNLVSSGPQYRRVGINIFHHNFGYIQTIATNEVSKYVTFYSSNLEVGPNPELVIEKGHLKVI